VCKIIITIIRVGVRFIQHLYGWTQIRTRSILWTRFRLSFRRRISSALRFFETYDSKKIKKLMVFTRFVSLNVIISRFIQEAGSDLTCRPGDETGVLYLNLRTSRPDGMRVAHLLAGTLSGVATRFYGSRPDIRLGAHPSDPSSYRWVVLSHTSRQPTGVFRTRCFRKRPRTCFNYRMNNVVANESNVTVTFWKLQPNKKKITKPRFTVENILKKQKHRRTGDK